MANPIKASDLYLDDGAILDAIEQLTALGEAHKKALKSAQEESLRLRVVVEKTNATGAQQRETLKETAGAADKLRREYDKLAEAMDENAVELARLKQAQSQQNAINKAEARVLASKEGSYNRLSAQYSLAKIRLNAMSEEERKATAEGQELERQARELYEQMKALQEATGKHTLSVGDYTKAIREAGPEQRKLAAELAATEQAFEEARKSGLASAEALAAYEQRVTELTEEIDSLGAITGKTAKDFRGGLLDGMADMDGVAGQAAKGVKGLGQAFKALLANPVVAVIALIVGGLTALFQAFKQSERGAQMMARISGTLSGIWSQVIGVASNFAGAVQKAFSDPLQALRDFWTALKENIVNRFEALIQLTGALGTALRSLWERDLDGLKTAAKDARGAIVQLGTGMDTEQQEKFTEAIREQTESVKAQIKAFGDLEVRKREVAKQNREIAKTIEQLTTQEELLLTVRDDNAKSFAEREEAGLRALELSQKRAKEEVRLAKNNLSLLNAEIDLRSRNGENVQTLLDAQLQAYREVAAAERGLLLAQRESEKEMAMIKQDRLEKDLDILIDGVDNQKTINERIIADEKRTFEERAALLEQTRALVDESYRQQVATIQQFTGAAVDANELVATTDAVALNQKIRSLGLSEIIEGRLLEVVRERRTFMQDLYETEQTLNEQRAKAAAEETERQKAALAAAKEAELEKFDQLVEFEESKLELAGATEAEKTKFALQAERDRLAKLLELNEKYNGDLTDLQKATLQNRIAAITAEIEKAAAGATGEKSIYEMLGLTVNDEQKQAIEDSFATAKDALADYMAKRTEFANQAVQKSGEAVEAARDELQAQIEMAQLGFASKAETARKELEAAKATQAKALKEQERAQQAQQALQAIQQASNLITASSKIWATLGFPAAIPALAIMWGSFLATQVQAFSATKRKYGEGGFEYFGYGNSHASGRDIPLGTTPDGKVRTVERGEAMAVFNKRQTARMGPLLPQIVAMINAGTFEQHFRGLDTAGAGIVAGADVDTSRMEGELSAIRKQGERRYTRDSRGQLVETYKNIRRIYVQ